MGFYPADVCVCVSAEGNHIKMFMRGRPITMFIPSDVENYDDVRTELPPERLKLEWVYPRITLGVFPHTWERSKAACALIGSYRRDGN